MIQVGPYTFTVGDARRTLGPFDDLWEEITRGRDASLVAHLRAEADAAIAGVDATTAPADALVEPLRLAWSAMLACGPALRAAGALPARREGRVAALALGSGGVPKESVPRVEVTHRGVVGDTQRTRKHHGRPFQALCLWSSEIIDELRLAGHPIAPGLAGENITVSGLDWNDVRPGVRLQIGTVVCDISSYATPCRQNSRWFLAGDHRVIHEDRGPVSRMYATVVEPGSIDVGDIVVLEP